MIAVFGCWQPEENVAVKGVLWNASEFCQKQELRWIFVILLVLET